MSAINIVARLHLKDGMLEKAVEGAKGAIANVREKDPGTVRYDWYLSGDKKTITVLESYESSEAVLAHMGNLGDMLGAILELGTLELEVFGEPSEELSKAAAQLGPKVHSTIATL